MDEQKELDETLLSAAKIGNVQQVKKSLDRGASINCRDDASGFTPLHWAAYKGHTEAASLLVENKGEVNIKNAKGSTPLHLAAYKGHTEAASLLIENSGEVNIKEKDGFTPLHLAAQEGHTEVASLLIENSGEVNIKENKGWTPLHLAAQNGHTEAVSLLIENSGEVNIKTNKGETPLDIARRKGRNDVVELLEKYISGEDPVSKQLSTMEDILPSKQVLSEIKMLGFETTKGFEEVMKKGSYKCYFNRVHLVGNFNIGKTTLAKVLVGDPIPEVRDSTDGIWLFIGLSGMDIRHRQWIFLQQGKSMKTVITAMLMSIKAEDVSSAKEEEVIYQREVVHESAPADEVGLSMEFKSSKSFKQWLKKKLPKLVKNVYPKKKQDKQTKQEPSPTSPTSVPETVMDKWLEGVSNEQIQEMVIEVLKEGKYKLKIVPIDIWDFGGQKDYYMTHQLFITSRGIFVLMFNGSHGIHEHIPDLAFLPGHHGKPTTAVYLKHWVNSILTYCRRTPDCFPRIVLVATHKDKIAKAEIESQRQMLIESISRLFESHAGFGHLECKSLIFIDARDKTDPEIATLRQLLIDRAFEHPRWGEDMPTAWVPLELELAQEVENGNNIISREQLEALNSQNKSFTLTATQLESFLKIQHSLGKLIYFDDIRLRNFIIINPVYMIEVLRSIVTDKQFWPKGEKFKEAHHRLREEGMIDRTTILAIWEQEEFRHITKFKDFMIEMLVHLDIIIAPRGGIGDIAVPVHQMQYFLVPCMITKPDNTDYIEMFCTAETTIIMAYTFIDDVIPPALCYRFVGSFLTMWNLKMYKGRKMIFSNLAVVQVDGSHDVAVQVKEKRVVVSLIHSEHKEKIAPGLASSIQECLTAAVYRISEFYSSLTEDQEISLPEKTSLPFKIDVGVLCQSSTCYFNRRNILSLHISSWRCPQHQIDHDVSLLRHWFTEKTPAEKCPPTCQGPGKQELEQCPSDQHIRRMVSKLGVSTCRELAIHLGLEVHIWEDLEYQFQHDNIDNIKFMAIWKWKEAKNQELQKPSFKDLTDALQKCNCNIHCICQVFWKIQTRKVLNEKILDSVPSLDPLRSVSDYIGNSSLLLGIELGLTVPQLENIRNQLKNKPLEQTMEILRQWKESSHLKPTVRTLVKALTRINKASCLESIVFQ